MRFSNFKTQVLDWNFFIELQEEESFKTCGTGSFLGGGAGCLAAHLAQIDRQTNRQDLRHPLEGNKVIEPELMFLIWTIYLF